MARTCKEDEASTQVVFRFQGNRSGRTGIGIGWMDTLLLVMRCSSIQQGPSVNYIGGPTRSLHPAICSMSMLADVEHLSKPCPTPYTVSSPPGTASRSWMGAEKMGL